MLGWLLAAGGLALAEYLSKKSSADFVHDDAQDLPPPNTNAAAKDATPDAPAHPAATRTKKQAALSLLDWLHKTPEAQWGTKAKPSAVVRDAQRDMGNLLIDGVYGTNTQTRAQAVSGKVFPSRGATQAAQKALQNVVATTAAPSSQTQPFDNADSYESRPVTNQRGLDAPLQTDVQRRAANDAADAAQAAKTPDPGPQGRAQTQAAAAAKALPKQDAHKRNGAQAAADLYTYLTRVQPNQGEWGTKQKPNATVRAAQLDMGGLTADGEYGDKTEARGNALSGKKFPHRAAAATASRSVTQSVTPAASSTTPAQPGMSDAQAAANALDAYIRAGGTRSRDFIADRQWAMGIDTDGLPGPGTKKQAESLLGRALTWPTFTPAGPVPGGATAVDAAKRLYRYVKNYGGSHADRIKAYQKVMGVDPAGVVGPVTKAKVSNLIGMTL